MQVYVVRSYIDPYSSEEIPVLLFNHQPTESEVWDVLSRMMGFEEEDALEENWDWRFKTSLQTVIN